MQVVYNTNSALPQLAWLARLNLATGQLQVEHGAHVETHDRFFIEGVWAGKFDEGRLLDTEVVFGSGAVVDDTETVWFVPSLSTTDFLYYRTDGDTTTVANSLALLLAASGDILRADTQDYLAINRTVMKGIQHYERDIPTHQGRVRRLMYHNLRVGTNGPAEVEKPMPPEFPTFDAYFSYLTRELRGHRGQCARCGTAHADADLYHAITWLRLDRHQRHRCTVWCGWRHDHYHR